jgi:hypothetical protein
LPARGHRGARLSNFRLSPPKLSGLVFSRAGSVVPNRPVGPVVCFDPMTETMRGRAAENNFDPQAFDWSRSARQYEALYSVA